MLVSKRSYSPADRLIGEINKVINVLYAPQRAARKSPSAPGERTLTEAERRESGRLMRVNHSGEIAAQALYRGQSLTARDDIIAAALHKAADEELDHLAWCEQRLSELGERKSLLNPLWYLGSFAIGAAAGVLGDRASLGFIAETEKQVETHLRNHRERLPAADRASRAIVEQMTREEAGHGATAASLGGQPLPFPLRSAMRITSSMLTHGSYWL